jgi:hypothetical protein
MRKINKWCFVAFSLGDGQKANKFRMNIVVDAIQIYVGETTRNNFFLGL